MGNNDRFTSDADDIIATRFDVQREHNEQLDRLDQLAREHHSSKLSDLIEDVRRELADLDEQRANEPLFDVQ